MMTKAFEASYPNTAYFVDAIGYIEIGHDEDSPLTSFIRALDAGGMVWEGKDEYASMDDAFADLEAGLTAWMHEVGLDEADV